MGLDGNLSPVIRLVSMSLHESQVTLRSKVDAEANVSKEEIGT